EVILNGDSPTLTRVVDGVVQAIAPTTAEQRLAKKNELKARGTLLMALPDKHQLKLNIHKDAKSPIEAIEKRFGGNKETKKVQKTLLKQQYENFSGSSSKTLDQILDRIQKLISQLEILADLEDQSLDDLFNNLKIYEAEVKSSSSTSHTTQNIAFVSSNNTDNTNESVSVVPSVSTASTKALVSTLPNVDNLSNVVIYSFFATRRFLQRTRRNLSTNGTTTIRFDMSKVECYNCHRRGHFARECRSPRDTRNKDTQRRTVPVKTSTSNALVSQCDGVGSDNEIAPCSKACSKAYDTLQSHYDKLIVDLRKSQFDVLLIQIRDNALVELRKKFEKAKKERDELKHTLQKFRTSSKNLNDIVPTSPVHDRYKSGEGYHAVPPPYTRTVMPSKPDLVFYDASTASDTVPNVFNVERSTTQPNKDMTSVKPVKYPRQAENLRTDNPKSRGHKHSWNRKACFVCKSLNHLIKDCDFYEKKWSKSLSILVPLTASRPVTTAVPQTTVKNQRLVKHVVHKEHSLIRRPINHRLAPKNSNFYQKVTTVKANKGNSQQALEDKGVIDNGFSRHMTGNISSLSDFEEINEGYAAFGGNLKGGKITGKGKIKTGNLDFDDVYFVKELKFYLFSVLKENNIYNVDLKNVAPSGVLTCLFAKATLDESNLWHRRLGHINFKTMNKLVKGSGPKWLFDIDTLTQSMNYQLVVVENQPNHNADHQNIDDDAAFDVKEPENEVHVSLSSSNQPKKHDEKAKKEAKGKSPIDLSTGVRDLRDEFEEVSVNNISRVNATSAPVTAVRLNLTKSTNSFNAASPSDNSVSPNFEIGGKSSFVDPSQYPDDPDMSALEDIIYSDDEEDVGAEADFSNLETNKSVNPIPTTRVYKDHPVSRIIVKQKDDRIFISQDKYVAKILWKFGLTYGKSASTPIDTEKPLLKNPDVKRIFRYLKGKPHFGLWYPKDSPFTLVAYSDSDYAGASLDRKSTTGGCQFLGVNTPRCDEDRLIITAVSYMINAIWSDERCCSLNAARSQTNGVKLQALIDRKKVVITEDTIRQALRLDDAVGVECLPIEEIFAELARIGYEKPPPKLTFYKSFFSDQWKFLIHMIVQCMSVKRTAWNEFSSSMASAVICLTTDDLSSHNTKYTSLALTQKVVANMRRIGKGFSGVETPLPQVQDAAKVNAEDEDDNEVSAAPTPPQAPSPPPQEHIPSPPEAQPAPPLSPPQQQHSQPADTSESSMTILNT
nr:hypothetical protein [Tanacetum cinerariifolium]